MSPTAPVRASPAAFVVRMSSELCWRFRRRRIHDLLGGLHLGVVDNADAYRQGLAYNQRIAGAAAQAKLGWRDKLDLRTKVEAAAHFPRRLRRGRDLAITAEIEHPAALPIRSKKL